MTFNKEYFIDSIEISGTIYKYISISKIADFLDINHQNMPCILKIIIENNIRNSYEINKDDIVQFKSWMQNSTNSEIAFMPTRILMQDFTGIPALVDITAMRDAVQKLNKNPKIVDPLIPVDLIIDHSVQVDFFGSEDSYEKNIKKEYERNKQRYQFLRWCQKSFNNLKIVPPGMGICHEINLEFLGNPVIMIKKEQDIFLSPETIFGTDSHTTMINALGILGWGVGGIEAEAAMLGQPTIMPLSEIVGVKLVGKKREDVSATDIVLHITNILRKHNVVSKFIEFYGDGLQQLTIADRATIANMAPEYGATCGFFAIDNQTIDYLKLTGRTELQLEIIKKYSEIQGLTRDYKKDPTFNTNITINIDDVVISHAGPKRPQDLIFPSNIQKNFEKTKEIEKNDKIKNGDVVIAAITSCTNTSNPYVMIGAGVLAQNLVKKGLKTKPWVKTSMAPGSRVVTEYLKKLGLLDDLNNLGFNLVGYGCTTCIGNSGSIDQKIAQQITEKDLNVVAVLSGNRNFEGRIHRLVKSNYLMSPMFVVLYAITGTVCIDITKDPIGKDKNGNFVYMKDVMPTEKEILNLINSTINKEMFIKNYSNIFNGDENWQNLKTTNELTYKWNEKDLYIQEPPYFDDIKTKRNLNIKDAYVLAVFGDSVTTDHISPAGEINAESPAGKFLLDHGLSKDEFNSYGSRRGNHNIMIRGTFANPRIKNLMLKNIEGGFSKHIPTNKIMNIYDVAMEYKKNNNQLVIIAGKEYGTGSSRDWAAKGTALLNICCVLAESFERIHLSNLIGMGVLPFIFTNNNIEALNLKNAERVSILDIDKKIAPNALLECIIQYSDKTTQSVEVKCMLKTDNDVDCIKQGGVLLQVLKKITQ